MTDSNNTPKRADALARITKLVAYDRADFIEIQRRGFPIKLAVEMAKSIRTCVDRCKVIAFDAGIAKADADFKVAVSDLPIMFGELKRAMEKKQAAEVAAVAQPTRPSARHGK